MTDEEATAAYDAAVERLQAVCGQWNPPELIEAAMADVRAAWEAAAAVRGRDLVDAIQAWMGRWEVE